MRTLFFFFFFFFVPLFSSSFFRFCFFLMLYVSVHKISILSSLCPNNFLFFFSSLNFSYGYCSTFQTYHHNNFFIYYYFFFFNSANLSFTWVLSIQFSSYFVINNVMLFDLVLNFKTQTMSQILEPTVLPQHMY